MKDKTTQMEKSLTQGEKRHAALVEKYGSEEAYQAKLKEWGSRGGQNSPSRLDKQSAERRKEISEMGRQAWKEKLRQHGIEI